MQDLFEEAQEIENANAAAPLATRMRPRSLEEFVGQEHILGPGKLLRRAIEADRLPSVIFYGPPASGKTTLALIIAEMTHAKFVRISGVESNVAEMRRVLAAATNRLRTSEQKTILFVDEIHHFNKAQQDILLPDVEAGNLRLIGATTYNPFFYVNSALVSRSQVFRLEPLSLGQLEQLIDRAVADKERGLGNYNVKIDKDARRHLAKLSDGDARKCLNALEIGVLTTPAVFVDATPSSRELPPCLNYFDPSTPMGACVAAICLTGDKTAPSTLSPGARQTPYRTSGSINGRNNGTLGSKRILSPAAYATKKNITVCFRIGGRHGWMKDMANVSWQRPRFGKSSKKCSDTKTERSIDWKTSS